MKPAITMVAVERRRVMEKTRVTGMATGTATTAIVTRSANQIATCVVASRGRTIRSKSMKATMSSMVLR